jgi:hypothetical protein
MRTTNIEPCVVCGTPTNYYDSMMGRRCPSCEWDAVHNFKIGLAEHSVFSTSLLEKDRDDGSCVLGKNKQEWLNKEPDIKIFSAGAKFAHGVYVST